MTPPIDQPAAFPSTDLIEDIRREDPVTAENLEFARVSNSWLRWLDMSTNTYPSSSCPPKTTWRLNRQPNLLKRLRQHPGALV